MGTTQTSPGSGERPKSGESTPRTSPSPSCSEAEATIQRAAQIARENAERKNIGRLPRPELPDGPAVTVDRTETLKRIAASTKLWSDAGVPERYKLITLDDLSRLPEHAEGKPVRSEYARVAGLLLKLLDDPGLIGMHGPRGTGKSAMACGLVREYCRRGRSARYCDAMDIFVAVKATYNGQGNEAAAEQAYIRPELLVIDEVHERGDTAWEDRMLTRIINKRYLSKRSTVLIANLTAKDFASRMGESAANRMLDGGGLILCNWPCLRGRVQ